MSASRRVLFQHCLRFDVFEGGSAGTGARLYSGVLGAVLLSTLLGVQFADQDPTFGIPALLTLTSVFAFFGLLGEFGAGFLDGRDVALLRTQPVAGRHYFEARLWAFGVWMGLRVLAFGLVPAVLVSTFGRGPWYGFFSYLVALWALFAVLAGVAILVFLLLQRLFDAAWLRDALVWLQVGLFVLGTAGWLFLLQASLGEAGLAFLADPSLPPTWFAEWHLLATGVRDTVGKASWAAGGCALAVGGLLWWMGRRYLTLLGGLSRPDSRTGTVRQRRLSAWFERSFVRAGERAGFHLARLLIRRERIFRLQSYPLLAYPLLFLAFGRGQEDGGLFAILFSHLLALYLPLAALFLRFSDHAHAAWLVEQHRQGSLRSLWSGATKALVFAVVLPVELLITVLLVWDMGWMGGLSNGAVALAVATWVARSAPVPGHLPFSQSFHGVFEARDEMSRVYPLLFGAVLVGVGQYLLWSRAPAWMPVLAVALLAATLAQLRRAPQDVEEVVDRPLSAEMTSGPEVKSEPFPVRLRREARGLVILYTILLTWAWILAASL